MHELIIIGGGPAGLAATVYAARKQLKTLLVSVDIGGQMSLTLGIENYLGYQFIEGPELIDKFQTQVSQFPIDQKIGDAILINKLADAKNLSIFTEHQTEKVEGEVFVNGVLIKDLKSSESKRLAVTGIFIEIGLMPNSEAVKGLIELNKWGEVPVTCACETTIPGLYAAGDVTNIPEKQIIVAAGEGAKAALQAHRYLQRLVT